MTAPSTSYAFRSLKQLGLVSGAPDYAPVAQFVKPENAVKTYKYSPDGRFFASASSTGVQILDASTASVVVEIPLKTAIDISFSPKGTHLSTWERPIKMEEGQPGHKNLKVWDSATGAELAGWAQKSLDGWALQYTDDESKAVRIVTNEVQVYDPSNFGAGVVDKLRLEGVTTCSVSPGRNPSVALFVSEKKGAPASVKIHSLAVLSSVSASKTFFKADKIQMKWNKSGTSLLYLTQTEVDKTGKSYYGESNLYMMNAAGTFDCRVSLDKEGGIHDFDWSPNENEFVVTYGYMPAKTVIFDKRVKLVHDFGTHPRNFLAYNPQGRLLCIAGFGNLAGQVDIWDRKTLKKVCTIDAPNTSHCEWSPDGRYLLCATLSPRLRVDNGLRIFHYTGTLTHVEHIEELYQASWRPIDVAHFPFGGPVEAAPVASASASSTPIKAAAPAGAYRPPHARGTATPTFFKREDEGGIAYNPTNGTNNFPSSGNGRTSPNFQSRGRRTIPGAAAPDAAPADGEDGKSRRKKKEANKKKGDSSNGPSGAATPVVVEVVPEPINLAAVAAAEALSSDDKKRRALMKKLTAIDQLKTKKESGEKLELTQYKKLESEAEIRKELAALDVGK
ncbi:translation initiation factor 2A, partial [Phenoliferia sp. Uapishka_3]